MMFDDELWAEVVVPLYLGGVYVESLAVTRGFIQKQITIKADKQVGWYYPTSGTDASIELTFPFVPSETSDSIWLARCSTTTGSDETFGPIVEFNIPDSTTIDSVALYLRTSAATGVALDSFCVTYVPPGTIVSTAVTPIAAWGTDRSPTSFTRYRYDCAIANLRPGSKVRLRLRIGLTDNSTALFLADAELYGKVLR
jgi:hypothetical protein